MPSELTPILPSAAIAFDIDCDMIKRLPDPPVSSICRARAKHLRDLAASACTSALRERLFDKSREYERMADMEANRFFARPELR